jgi:hypothetical protein
MTIKTLERKMIMRKKMNEMKKARWKAIIDLKERNLTI